MNSLESSNVVYSRLSSLDPENASKIMGFILIHGPNEADMMSLASAPDSLLQQLIARGKTYSSILTSKNSTLEGLLSPNGFKATPSYASVVNGSCKLGEGGVEEEVNEQQLTKCDDLVFDLGLGGERLVDNHRRSLSVSLADEMMNGGGGGYGWRSSSIGGCGGGVSPGKFDGFEQEMLQSRATQQQRLALANSYNYNKYLTDSPRSMATAMLMEEELHKLGQLRHDLSDIAFMGSSSSSRQIYLTFPADSTFREEDVSNYFSIYGPVQDVRIPYQQKRMFGFVTFVHPETVKIILAKGNPHFVCESRVLVKPYKEKGKVEKKHLMTQQQLERGDLSCLSPHGADIRDFDVRVGPRMFYNNTQELLMRKKLEEQAEFQKTLEIQSRKLANLQLLDLNNLPRRHPFSQSPNLSPAAAMSSPTHHPLLSPNHMRSMGSFNQNAFEENITAPTLSLPPHVLANRQMSMDRIPNINNHNAYTTNNTSENGKLVDSIITKSNDQIFPDSLDDTTFARSASSRQPLVTNDKGASCSSPFTSNSSSIVSSACLSDAALPKSRFLDSPSFGATGSRVNEM